MPSEATQVSVHATNGTQARGQGAIERQEFNATQVAQADAISAALAAQAEAQVQARYIMAMRRPRDMAVVRQRLLKECQRSSFAEVALYEKPIGGGGGDEDENSKTIEGASIRFAEAAMRCMGNMGTTSATLYDDDQKRIVRVTAIDYESNADHSKDITIPKVVERKWLRQGQKAISSRMNSYGKPVHLIQATDDQMLNKEGALLSKGIRTNILRLLPGDLIDEALTEVRKTLESEVAKNPDAERNKVFDAFFTLSVEVADLKTYLGHDPGKCSPAQIVKLRSLYNAIKDGQTTWAEVMEQRQAEIMSSAKAPPAPPAAATPAAQPTPEQQANAAALTNAAEAAQQQAQPPKTAPTPALAADPLADFEKRLRATPAGPDRIKLMRDVGRMPAHLQAPARDVYNRVTDEEAQAHG